MAQSYTTLSAGLTSIFTPPASCSSSWTYEAEFFNAVSGGLLIQNALTNFDTSCWPASFTANGRANGLGDSPIQVYSPGICPSGYTTAGGFTQSGTTTGICCLRNYAYITEYSSQNFATDSILFEGCISTYPLAYGSTVVDGRVSPSALSATTVTGPLTMWAQPMLVEYQETDLALFPATTTSSTSSLTSSTAEPSSTNSPPTSSTAAASPTPIIIPDNGLSTGAKAGIGVGAALGALLILGALLFFCLRRRRTPRSQATPTVEEQDSPWQRSELAFSEPKRELEGSKAIARKPVAQEIIELE